MQMSADALRDKITATINDSAEIIKDEVVKHFSDIEIKRRTKLIIDGMTKLSIAEADLAKLKPDHIVFDNDGKAIQQGWSAPQKGKRDKAQGLVHRTHSALTAAIVDADFKRLEELLKEGGNKPQQESGE
jgi:hypothetical protein